MGAGANPRSSGDHCPAICFPQGTEVLVLVGRGHPQERSYGIFQLLLSVDDDSDVLRPIERDLRSRYGAEFRVIQRTVKKHQGNIQVSSKPGDTRFQVWLPLANARG